MTASLRGRPLNGKKIQILSSYKGYVMNEPRKNFSEEEDRHLKITNTFKHFMYWNLDKPVTANDRLMQAIDWIDIAKAMHSPVDEENSQKSIGGEH